MPAPLTRDEMLAWWREGWTIAMQAIEALTGEDLERTIYIRGKGMLVVEALNRSATHTAYHVGQIVYLVRHLTWPEWTPLTIPKGKGGRRKGRENRGKESFAGSGQAGH